MILSPEEIQGLHSYRVTTTKRGDWDTHYYTVFTLIYVRFFWIIPFLWKIRWEKNTRIEFRHTKRHDSKNDGYTFYEDQEAVELRAFMKKVMLNKWNKFGINPEA